MVVVNVEDRNLVLAVMSLKSTGSDGNIAEVAVAAAQPGCRMMSRWPTTYVSFFSCIRIQPNQAPSPQSENGLLSQRINQEVDSA